MEVGETKPMIGKQRADKINSIIKQSYNQLIATTSQHRISREVVNQLVQKVANRVLNLRDIGFLNFHTLSFTLNTAGLKKDKTYPLIAIKPGQIITDDVQFLGVNDNNAPTNFLNNYGFFYYTSNKIAKEMQISFRCIRDCPSTTFGVYMTVLYNIADKMKGDK